MGEFKAKIASHSTAIAQIFNAEIVRFTCRVTNHALFSASLTHAFHNRRLRVDARHRAKNGNQAQD